MKTYMLELSAVCSNKASQVADQVLLEMLKVTLFANLLQVLVNTNMPLLSLLNRFFFFLFARLTKCASLAKKHSQLRDQFAELQAQPLCLVDGVDLTDTTGRIVLYVIMSNCLYH